MHVHCVPSSNRMARARGFMAALSAALLAGACSSGSGVDSLDSFLTSSQPPPDATSTASAPQQPKTELDKAIAYWAEQYKKQPHDLKTALSYARNLKAAGHKDQAFGVLQNAALLHGDNMELASEYGRMALEYDQVSVAEKLLAMADDPTKPDWKLISARGTVMAKQGRYPEAIPFYERALAVSPGQTSVLNNLAMAHAAGGEPAKAEQILRDASTKSKDPKIKQNLALVLGLQGKHDEARNLASTQMPAETATANTDYIRRLVKADTAPAPAPITTATTTASAPATVARAAPARVKPAAAPATVAAAAPAALPAATPAVAAAPSQPTPTPARAAETSPGMGYGWRPSGKATDVESPAGAWATTVSRSR